MSVSYTHLDVYKRQVLAQPRHQAQGFHVGPERMVVLRREEGDAGIVTILPGQRECFRQQLDASEVVGLSLIHISHHPGDALYRNARGQCQGPERMPGHVVGQVLFPA